MWNVKLAAVPTITGAAEKIRTRTPPNTTKQSQKTAILLKAYILRKHINVAFNHFAPNDAYTASQGAGFSCRITQFKRQPIRAILLSRWCLLFIFWQELAFKNLFL
jgi:hypothetical protein